MTSEAISSISPLFLGREHGNVNMEMENSKRGGMRENDNKRERFGSKR